MKKDLKKISNRLKRKIKSSKNILVIASRPPDLDSICTTIALKLYLKNLGKDVKAYSFSEIPKKVKDIEEIFEIEEKYTKDVNFCLFDLIILIDGNHWHTFFTNSWEKVLPNIDLRKIFILDHHLASKIEEDLPQNTIRKEDSSTSKIVFDYALDSKKISKKVASLLYMALVSDTQFFKVLVFKDTFLFANKLASFDINLEDLNERVLKLSRKEIEFLYFLYEHTEFIEEAKTSFLVIDENLEEKIKLRFGKNFKSERLDESYKELILRRVDGFHTGLIFSVGSLAGGVRVLWRTSNIKASKNLNKILKKAGFITDGHLGAGVGKIEKTELSEVVNKVKKLLKDSK